MSLLECEMKKIKSKLVTSDKTYEDEEDPSAMVCKLIFDCAHYHIAYGSVVKHIIILHMGVL